MLAESFWGSDVGLLVVLGAWFMTVFLLTTFLMGSRARARREARLAKRLGRRQAGEATEEETTATHWVPQSFAKAGKRFATATGFSAGLDARLESAGMPIAAGEFVALTTLCVVLGAIVGALFLQNVVFVLLIAFLTGIIPYFMMVRAQRKRRNVMQEQLADALAILASSLRAGYSFLQALDTVSKEIGEPSAAEFQRVVAEIRLGRPIEDALVAMSERIDSEDLKWAVIAINVQRQVGGNLAEVLDVVANTVRERAYIHRQVQVLSAEGRLSVVILSCLPFGIMLYIAVVNPDYIKPLFTTTPGLVLTIGGGIFMALGIFIMTRMIKIDV
jgi:tight adherence protein B